MACSLRMEAVIFRIKVRTTQTGGLYSYILEDHGTHVGAVVKCRHYCNCYSLVYLIPLLIRSTFLTRRKGRLFVEIPLTTSANSVSSTREGSAAGGRAGETVVLKKKKVNIEH